MTDDVPIRDESIRLGQFLKLANLIENGSDAKIVTRRWTGPGQRRGRDPPRPPAGVGDVVTLGGQSARVSSGEAEIDVPW